MEDDGWPDTCIKSSAVHGGRDLTVPFGRRCPMARSSFSVEEETDLVAVQGADN